MKEREKGVNFNVIKMGKERESYSGMNKERKKERKKEKRITHFETRYPCLLWVMKERKRENKGWTIFEGSHFNMYEERKKEREEERER